MLFEYIQFPDENHYISMLIFFLDLKAIERMHSYSKAIFVIFNDRYQFKQMQYPLDSLM